jgi:L-gulonolactone oxidase
MGNLACSPVEVFRPTTLPELQSIVRRAAADGRRVRAFGTRHSWMPLVPTDDYLVDITGLTRCLAVDADARTIRVEGGMTLGTLTAIAQEFGLAVRSPTVADVFTVAGMVATGSHGSGMHVETFPDSVVSMTIVNADGEVVEIGHDDPDLPIARVALGSLGLIYAVTLQCDRATNLRCRTLKLSVADAMARLDELVGAHDCVMVMWYPYTSRAIVMLYDRTDAAVTFGPIAHRLNAALQYVIEGVIGKPFLQWTVRHAPELVKWPMRLAAVMTREFDRVETQIDGVHWQFVYPLVWDSSWAVPREDAAAAWQAWIDELDAFEARGQYPISMVMFLRFVQSSDSPLSPGYGRDTCFIEATSLKETPDVLAFYRAVEQRMLDEFDGRPHWAKRYDDLERIRAMARDRIVAADAVRRRWDPDGRFTNDFLERLFAPFE